MHQMSKCGHSASDCKYELRILRCAGKHTVKNFNEWKEQAIAQTLIAHTQQCIKTVPHIRTPWPKQINRNKKRNNQSPIQGKILKAHGH